MKLTIRQIVYTLLVSLLFIFSFSSPIYANNLNEATVKSKSEVVYINLTETGKTEDVYVVNIFDVSHAGKIVDYGNYERVKNLTNIEEIEQQGEKITAEAEEGTFYYQGDLIDTNFPWKFEVTYYLNGKELNPEDLVGEDGKFEINLKVKENKLSDPLFFEHYMLQITLPFDKERFTNIEADDATIANVGKEQQVTFTTLPNEEAEFTVAGEASSFEFDGIQIAGVPFSFAFEDFDFSEMENDMTTLTDAIKQLHDGVGDLQLGVSQLNDGTEKLRHGSSQFNQGLNTAANSSHRLVDGSAEINKALKRIDAALANNEISFDPKDIEDLGKAMNEFSNGLEQIATGLKNFQNAYNEAWTHLEGAIESIPDSNITEQRWSELYVKNVDPQLINELIEMYQAALTVKGTYEHTKDAFAATNTVLNDTHKGIAEIASYLQMMNEELANSFASLQSLEDLEQLMNGLNQLANQYEAFHNGLVAYTGGVSELAAAYGEIDNGIGQLTGGTSELAKGSIQLHDGTGKLYDATKEMPEELKERIDDMLADYDMSDFIPASFVSKKNDNIELVQFVFQSEPIKTSDRIVEKEPEKEKKGFWELLKALFHFN